MTYILLSAFGKDRPGIVAHVTGLVFQAGGNIEDASMTRLGGEFAMMLVVGLSNAKKAAPFLKTLPAMQKKLGLTLNARTISGTLAHTKHHTQATHLISVYGADQPGIVYKTAEALAKRKINITDLNTRTLERSGKPLYVMLLEVQIPNRSKAQALQQELYRLGRSLRLDVTFQEIDFVPL
jgi:glycine cleavage system transcriptional repressor